MISQYVLFFNYSLSLQATGMAQVADVGRDQDALVPGQGNSILHVSPGRQQRALQPKRQGQF